MLSFYGTELGVKVARKHLGWYLEEAGLPRGDMLVLDDPAAVLSRIREVFSDMPERAAA